ncbi:prolipoprotein diacylglyceryl transferase family protein [Cohnella algarum]|uniref:prolipoprotein diacylglyceryl transferase family protein n=1 Tax=Cohnella algarum TaxID=2044859 RepID=UPI001967647A|nr:prolipoprotein diacylglyceryl transferase family protein [Cohnella algarum]MBN2981800.1 prolipoprotein diacylglyceryl transferase [Cohnella algarum]
MSGFMQLGPFAIRLDWFYYGLSALLGFLLAKIIIKRKSLEHMPYLELIFNAAAAALLVWKISPVFSDLSLLAKPFALLRYPGTSLGGWLGCLAAIAYLVLIKWTKKFSWTVLLDVFSIVLLGYAFVYSLSHWQYGNETTLPWAISLSDPTYQYHPVNVYQAILLVPLIGAALKFRIGEGKTAFFTLTGYGMSLLAISLLTPKLSALYGLSVEQWAAVLFIALGVLAYRVAVLQNDHNNR